MLQTVRPGDDKVILFWGWTLLPLKITTVPSRNGLSVLLTLSAEESDECSRHRLLDSDDVNIDTVADETSDSKSNVRWSCFVYDEDIGDRISFGELVEYRMADNMVDYTRGYGTWLECLSKERNVKVVALCLCRKGIVNGQSWCDLKYLSFEYMKTKRTTDNETEERKETKDISTTPGTHIC